jgi:hypothetical protein
MRSITHHAINPANEAIALSAVDGPGPGGASHVYHILLPADKPPMIAEKLAYNAYCEAAGWKSLVSGAPLPQWEDLKPEIQLAWGAAACAVADDVRRNPLLFFQNGPVKESGEGVNGITHEVLFAILIDRLDGFQAGQYANDFNARALTYLRDALNQLHARTREREARGVEGTHKA